MMKRHLTSAVLLAALASPLFADHPAPWSALPATPSFDGPPITVAAPETASGTPGFSNFIGWMSNPPQNVDPRALTQLFPLFGSSWVSGTRALPPSDFQVYGAGLNVAVGERFSFGFNNGGYATASFDRDPRRVAALNTLRARFGRAPRQAETSREGWLDIGGFFQYTLIADVENQFLLTAGLNYVTPTGSSSVFQGTPPWVLAPYLTVGKEIGNFHVLATTGYKFPAGSRSNGAQSYYLNGHLDYQLCGWIYPLVEVNWSQSARDIDIDLQTRRGFFDLGNFDTTGSMVAGAAGVNFVLVRDRVEMGAVYTRSISSTSNVNFNGLLVKMLFRF